MAAPHCGCGKPTWNGLWNSLCNDMACLGPPQPAPLCGCGKPTWNGQWNEKCARSCPGPRIPYPAAPPPASCARCGCGKPTWNGQWNETCSRSCPGPRVASPVAPLPAGSAKCGCGKPTWNKQWNETCSRSCHGPRLVGPPGVAPPAVALCGCGKPTWNGQWNETCSRSCSGPRMPHSHPTPGPTPVPYPTPGPTPVPSLSISRLDPNSGKYMDLAKQYQITWDKGGKAKMQMPAIKDIWDVTNYSLKSQFDTRCQQIGNVGTFGKGTSPGNVQRRFHGTKMKCTFSGSPCNDSSCGVCGIIKNGFQMKYAIKGKKPSSLFFGRGLYSTSASSSAVRYAKTKTTVDGAVFIALVACGKCERLDGSNLTDTRLEDQDGAPSGCHSRVVDNPHGAKSYINLASLHGDPLLYCDDEVVVFDDDAMLPRYVITFR
eukprot:TRINITY_DN3848_c0_g3_i1.p1 TRINITY_DN3848_c0_g3~~TRINITY_DN3848_c0_g3_i1.p1  ORF type:complete len:431 (+),score=34.47 TRINITY_DN3848_c0_g3_i1:52-1344(+)